MDEVKLKLQDMTLQQSCEHYLSLIYGNFGIGRWGTDYASFYWSYLSTKIQQAGDETFFQNSVSQTTRERWYRAYYEVRLPSIIKDDNERLARPTEPCPGFHAAALEQIDEVQTRINEWVAAGKPSRILDSHRLENQAEAPNKENG